MLIKILKDVWMSVSFHLPGVLVLFIAICVSRYPGLYDLVLTSQAGMASNDFNLGVIGGGLSVMAFYCFIFYVKNWYLYFSKQQSSDQEAK